MFPAWYNYITIRGAKSKMQKLLQYFVQFLFPETSENIVFKRFQETQPALVPFSYEILYEYSESLKKYIHKIKFEHNTKLITLLSQKILADYHPKQPLDMIIPVPTHPQRVLHRGFEHTAKLIEKFAYFHKIPICTDIVYRESNTRPLFSLSAAERKAEIYGSFNIWPKMTTAISGKNILLFDDILTTGNTLKAVYTELQKWQPRSITVFCLSRPVISASSRPLQQLGPQ
jgi:ComF family protein